MIYSDGIPQAKVADCNEQVFSIALAVTNVIGVPVGGFGVPFTSLAESKAQNYLKVFTHKTSGTHSHGNDRLYS